ncbi:exodeoxyribonuclease V subunit gamma [Zophobihabitans entericus]|uniref:RecBCD enzyme subunit RecC n=1 Tax=Zophobihabitans entericus TaxID=1635327 RepID=A0A6G9I9J5_9GAMM|nr:exodeoxyribonuclease V subunit gamma [Zophobihabitans entericus]QIQ20891.1 exodeoxyribonuclease V subunit gamma [Zophobihabitans entericus]
MFTIYHSNQLELLKSLTAALIERDPLESVFTKEVVLVQSKGMAQWLQIQLAEEFGISANIDFILPANFIWHTYTCVLPDIPENNPFDKDAMSWKLMQILPELIEHAEFRILKKYISKDNRERKFYQLATRIADLFDQYLVYRPEWIATWEKGEHVSGLESSQEWQAPLWQALVEYNKSLGLPHSHRANIYQRFIESLSASHLEESIRAKLPKRIFIFGIASLPPMYLRSLYALSQHVEVHLMFTNPCRWYWGDIPDQRWLNKLLQTQWRHYQDKTERGLLKGDMQQFDFFMPVTQSNPLLASWGKLGRDNLFLLQEFEDKNDIEGFVDPGTDTLLHALQQNMLDLDDKSVVGHDEKSFNQSQKKQKIQRQDFSVSFHACHSEQREVEVLYDYLLSLLDSQPDLQPREIVVMVADIDRYAPYIQAVFGNAPKSRYLPYTISDQKVRTVHPIVQAFFTLLNIPQSRFTTEDLFDLLEVPALASQFDIDETQLKQLRYWVVESGIRWGLDDEMIESFNLPATGQHTWQFGLTRLLLGYVMKGQNGSWQNILPYDGATGLAAELVGKLADFLMSLTLWRKRLSSTLTLSEWRPLCNELLDTFFTRDQESEVLLMLIEQQWQSLIDLGIDSGYQQPMTITILHDALQMKLEKTQIDQRFLAGKISFCTMMPMRSIPFNVVCLLGMNDGVYPRTSVPLGFDLLAHHAQRGDRSRRDDDRYLFLEAILSAQRQLYISYIGRSIEDNSERYPSVLVDELREYLTQSYVLKGDEKLNIDESAASLLKHLTTQHARTPFSEQNYLSDKQHYHIQSYADEWLAAAQSQGQLQEFATEITPVTIETVTVDELKQFYRHSVRTLLQQRFNIYFEHREESLPQTEVFDLDNLERYQLNQELLNSLIKDKDLNQTFEQIKIEGLLPYGVFGDLLLKQQYQDMQQLALRVQSEKQPTETQEVNLTIYRYQLQGWLNDVQVDGLLRWRPGNLSIYDGMALWIEHLIYCCQSNNVQAKSRIYGRNDTQWCFEFIDSVMAKTYLQTLIDGYQQGMNQPLVLPLKSAWSWLESCFDTKKGEVDFSESAQQKALDKFMQSWLGQYQFNGEFDDYYRRVTPELTPELIEQILSTAQRYLLPVMLHRQEEE